MAFFRKRKKASQFGLPLGYSFTGNFLRDVREASRSEEGLGTCSATFTNQIFTRRSKGWSQERTRRSNPRIRRIKQVGESIQFKCEGSDAASVDDAESVVPEVV